MNFSKFNFQKKFKNKKVLVTGHTGFKGSWLTSCLVLLGAKVIGLSINVPSNPSHFKAINLQNKINHKKMDIRNLKLLKKIFKKYQPDYVFHLAAQALVKKSYSDPVYTWTTNTVGTINVLESLRQLKKKCVAVIITSDKSYKNLEIKRGYKEDDILGGKDPYSASKASAEVTDALVNQATNHNVAFEVGITVSSPGFYGPSSRFVDGLKNTLPDIKGSLSKLNIDGLKVLNMEMESSLFFHLCSQMGYRAGTICTVISAPTESDIIIDYDVAIGNTIDIGLKALIELNYN